MEFHSYSKLKLMTLDTCPYKLTNELPAFQYEFHPTMAINFGITRCPHLIFKSRTPASHSNAIINQIKQKSSSYYWRHHHACTQNAAS